MCFADGTLISGKIYLVIICSSVSPGSLNCILISMYVLTTVTDSEDLSLTIISTGAKLFRCHFRIGRCKFPYIILNHISLAYGMLCICKRRFPCAKFPCCRHSSRRTRSLSTVSTILARSLGQPGYNGKAFGWRIAGTGQFSSLTFPSTPFFVACFEKLHNNFLIKFRTDVQHFRKKID